MGDYKYLIKEAKRTIRSMGEYVFVAYFHDKGVASRVLTMLPYIFPKGNYGPLAREGTCTSGIPGARLPDGRLGVAIVTGGNLTIEEVKQVKVLFSEYSDIFSYEGPDLAKRQ